MKYQCLKSDFAEVEKRIKSIIKKLDKYGFSYDYKVLDSEVKSVPYYKVDPADRGSRYKHSDVLVEVQNYEFDMETLKLGDYLPVAIIEHDVVMDVEGVNNIVRIVNDTEVVKKEWLTIGGHCDDCNDNYNRKKTVILKNAQGEYRQVGTGCLKKYTGIDCFDIISIYGSVDEIFNTELYLEGNSEPAQDFRYALTREVLAACIDVMKADNGKYRSRHVSKPTVEQARDIIMKGKTIDSYDEADEIIKYYKDLIVSEYYEFCVGFDRDVCNACIAEYARINDGRVAYAYIAYKKLKEFIDKRKQREEDKLNSEYIGEIGEKITRFVKIDKIVPVETMYGLSCLYIFVDEEGNELTWFTASNVYADVGEWYNITGKVKEHKEYDGKKQTALTRVKFI